MSNILCNQCKREISAIKYVKCYNCNSNYHFKPCSPLSEDTYESMSTEKKFMWRCQVCKPRSRSPNTLYQAVVFDENNSPKQVREDDGNESIERAKKFKETPSLPPMNTNHGSLETKLTQMQSQIDFLVSNANATNVSNLQMQNDVRNALATITSSISNLSKQVSEIVEKDKLREKQINNMDSRINKLEQKIIERNIEIKNVENQQISPLEVVKKIAASRDVAIAEEDILRAYRIKNQKNKIIIEFSSLNKKQELMSKIERHRIDAKNSTESNNSSVKFIYINDQLTYNNRQLLWIAKTKARESKWKFIWVKNGNIYARKNENSPALIIKNAADIELITPINTI